MRSERVRPALAAIALAGLIAVPVQAAPPPTGSADDLRCLLLGSGYARAAKSEESRRTSAMVAAFFLGRLDGRLSDRAFAAAVRAQGKGLPPAQAEPLMRACAARAQAVQARTAAAIQAAQSGSAGAP